MRIVYLYDNFLPYRSGVVTFLENLASYMANNNHDVTILVAKRGEDDKPFHLNAKVNIITLESIPSIFRENMYMSFPGPLKVEALMHELKPDIIHPMSPEITSLRAILSANMKNVPVLITQHSIPSFPLVVFTSEYFPKKLGEKAIAMYYRTINNSCSHITAPSEYIKKDLKSYRVKREISVISNGVDTRRFRPRLAKSSFLLKYDLPHNVPLLTFVGRVEPEKSIDVLIKAFKRIHKKTKAHLVISGKGTMLDSLKNLTFDLNLMERVHFLGYIPDEELPDLYNASYIYINPAIYEAQCIAALEAAASGLPLIGANATALPEIVLNKRNGFLFKPGNDYDLSKKILQILNNHKLYEKMSQQSLEISSKHEQHLTYGKFEKLYENLIRNKKKKRFFFF